MVPQVPTWPFFQTIRQMAATNLLPNLKAIDGIIEFFPVEVPS
jgi:hypothetical protein